MPKKHRHRVYYIGGVKNIFRAPYKSCFYQLTLTLFLKIKLEKKEAEPEKKPLHFCARLEPCKK